MTTRPAAQPAPITPFVPTGPDADWETVRARVTARLAELVPGAWSDHNAADPGITLAESAAFGLADLHYRVAERGQDAWPLEVPDWLPDADRHWDHAFTGLSLTGIADALAGPTTSATLLETEIRACTSSVEATALLARDPWAGVFGAEERPVVIALMRGRLVRRVAQEQAHVIAGAVAAQRPAGGTVEQRDERAVVELAFALPLWEDEIRAVVRRERRRLAHEVLTAGLGADDLTTDEAAVVAAAVPQPLGVVPEDLEHETGHSKVWPPHPIQALTCEPVVAEDYARRARAHPDVRRAWAVPGRLEGVAWNGLPTGDNPTIEVDEDAPALTLVVERAPGGGRLTAAAELELLRDVLAVAIGPEVRAPFPDWRDPAFANDITPRRTICDEVGASLLRLAPIVVQGTLVTGVGIDPETLIDDVRGRIAAFFDAGRPETRAAAPSGEVDGPWPRIEQPAGGWVPGEPVRFTEVVAAIVANPDVWGVEQLGMKLQGAGAFVPQSAGHLDIPANAVPALADGRCLRVGFSLAARCGDA